MSQPWWKNFLEWLGRPKVPVSDRTKLMVTTGVPDADDASGSTQWFDYHTSEALFSAWGPLEGSVWEAFHCAPLFAALDRIPLERRGPTDPAAARELEAALAPLRDWLLEFPDEVSGPTWVVVDLPGALSVALAVDLLRGGCQTVCTFDHWPHPAGLLKPERILGQLLRHAPRADAWRAKLSPGAPPAWICDRGRLGGSPGMPREFDNRYFLDDSILPGPDILRQADIQRVLYISEEHGQAPVPDIGAYLQFLQKEKSFTVRCVGMKNPEAGFYSLPLVVPDPRYKNRNFQRAAAGGFGSLIPTESSSSG
jgi:hypothetical protein